VSVVIPCYNQAHYLASAIRSAVATRAAVAVIVADDGSTDETREVVSHFPNATLRTGPHGGRAAARNLGLEAASGDFLVFLDADDLLLPHAIDVGVRALQSDPACTFTFGRCVLIGPEGDRRPTPERGRVVGDVHDALLADNPMWTPAVVMARRRAVLEAGGFRPEFDAAADYDLYLRLASAAPAYDHGEVVAAYRRSELRVRTSTSRRLRDTLAVLDAHRPSDARKLALWQAGRRHWRELYGRQLIDEMDTHLRRGRPDAAIATLVTLVRLAPDVAAREGRRRLRRLYPRLPAPRPGGAGTV
jgi:glycosyltransferase involved in cell wall biosynthesis